MTGHHPPITAAISVAPADALAGEAAYKLRGAARRAHNRAQHAAARLQDAGQQALQFGSHGVPALAGGSLTAYVSPAYTAYKAAHDYSARRACAEMWDKVERAAGWATGDNRDQALLQAATAELEAWLDVLQADSGSLPQDSRARGFHDAEVEGRNEFMREVREISAWLRRKRREAEADSQERRARPRT
ncbi:hypothetical protein ACH4PU_31075 [Streptomyces sp. NPDC021100]|uniref:hypothetical protein n=1 Tax=Streptomyces sp. NPDC021100 TaxID=3365114 RepID=UPI0037A4475A